jgi:saccharopine dehydrogenase-like NADP-dependent oxidoreductase
MKKILILGAGRSSAHLIKYLLENAQAEGWHVRVADMDLNLALQKTASHAHSSAFQLNAENDNQRKDEIKESDLVISMLPAGMHAEIAEDCLQYGKHLITPSYVSDQMWALHEQAKSKGLLFLNEMGVDPGIDHMSAMQIIDRLQGEGAVLESFESFTGGLIAPECDNNPWNYKITWNPRNVVLAGYGGTARFQQEGHLKYIPYQRLFERITHVNIAGYGSFDGYANRDSLKYKKIYGLENIPTLYRGTLRRGGFCEAWNALVQLGLTDDSFLIEQPANKTWRMLTSAFVDLSGGKKLEKTVQQYMQASDVVMEKLKWLGIFDNESLDISEGSPAVALQRLIEKKWKLDEHDKDMIVMWHRFVYTKNGKKFSLQSSLVTPGEDPIFTAMSKTVGLPMAIAAKFILRGQFNMTGVVLPVAKEVYNPILQELHALGIQFEENEAPL